MKQLNEKELREEFRSKYDGANMANDGGGIATKHIHEIEDWWLSKMSEREQETRDKTMAEAFLKVNLALPFVSDGDKTEYARGVRDTVNNLRLDLKPLLNTNQN